MATMTITRTRTQTQTQTQTQTEATPSTATPQARFQQNGVTLEEHYASNGFLDLVPRLDRLQLVAPRTLREIIRPNLTARSGGGGSTTAPVTNILDEPIDILVLELGDAVLRRRLLSVDELRKYLRENLHPARRVYLVSQATLTEAAVGLLGSRLKLDPDFFALHITGQDPPLALNLPSSVAARQSLRFDYCSRVFLLKNDKLPDLTALSLKSHLRGDYENWEPTIFDAMAGSIQNSTYINAGASSSLSAVIYAAFPVIISQWTHLLSGLGIDAGIARATIDRLLDGSFNDEERRNELNWLRDTALNRNIHSLPFYDGLLRVLDLMLRALDDCKVLQPRLDGDHQVDSNLIESDIFFLQSYAQQLQRDNEVLFSKRSSILALSASIGSAGGDGNENPSAHPQTHYAVSLGAGGPFPPSGSGPPLGSGPPPGSVPPSEPGVYEGYAQHIQTKIDQIAYMTNLLISLSFIASVYGMNLDIFKSGEVTVSRYLATAIPFTLVVFAITFCVPAIVSKIIGGKRGVAQLKFQFE